MSVLVTGIGVVSALGGDAGAFAEALRQGRHGCGLHEFARLDGSVVRAPAYLAASPDPQGLIEPRKLRRMFRLARMAAVAARQALRMAGRDPAAFEPARIGVVFGTAFGALEITQKFIDSWVANGEAHASPLNFMNSVHGILASQIALDINATGVNLTISQRDISFEAALAQAMHALESGQVDLVLVGGADELTPLLHEIGSHMLQLSLDPADAGGLDAQARRGVLIPGEGAAVAVLEREGNALARLRAARVGRHDMGGPDVAEAAWQAAGAPKIELITGTRDGTLRVARVADRREPRLRAMLGELPIVSHRGAFGSYPTAGALQFAANVMMLAGLEALPAGAFPAPRAILHDAASTSGVHAAYVLTSTEQQGAG